MYTVCTFFVNTLCFKSGHNSRFGATKIECHQILDMDLGGNHVFEKYMFIVLIVLKGLKK